MFTNILPNISHRLSLLCAFKRFSHHNADAIVIASAARTPWGKFKGQLVSVSAWQLGQMAVETAVKQSAIPLEDVQQIIMAENSQVQRENKFVFSDFLKRSKYYGIKSESDVSATSLLKALDILKSESETVVVIGGMESATQQGLSIGQQVKISNSPINTADISSDELKNYIASSKVKFLKSQRKGIFDAELVPLNVRQLDGKRKIMREVTQDETSSGDHQEDYLNIQYSDGAAALVLTTLSKAKSLNLSPLAEIIDYEYITNAETIIGATRKCLENLFIKSQTAINNIHHWEIDDCVPQLVAYLKHHFMLNMEMINPHGSSLVMGHSPAISLPRLITHLAHALKPQKYGCIVSSTYKETFSLILKKLPPLSYADRLPLVTLYTKDPCSLCDILVEELESSFSGEYELEKVFIDTKENLRYLRLYRLDIPVVFLSNQFLCMHRLNHKLLRQKLDLLRGK